MPDPKNPNPGIPQRTEPATTPEPVAENIGDYGNEQHEEEVQDPTQVLSEQLSNPATVTAVIEFLKAEDLTIDDVTIKEGFWGWHEGADVATIEIGTKEYFVAPDDDTVHNLAVALVTQDLESEPGLFNQSFIESYVNVDRLRDMLRSDVEEQVREQLRYETRHEETSEDEEEVASAEELFEERVENDTEQQLRDPVQYLIDIYGQEEGVKQAINIAGINISEAAEDAVSADGEGHFLSTYDGNVNSLPSGGAYWRHN